MDTQIDATPLIQSNEKREREEHDCRDEKTSWFIHNDCWKGMTFISDGVTGQFIVKPDLKAR